ncbi:MAG: hypothetical protein V7K48_08700 [Nostoc sp.]
MARRMGVALANVVIRREFVDGLVNITRQESGLTAILRDLTG